MNKKLIKEGQFCDNKKCSRYNKVDAGNVCVKSTRDRRFYCNVCRKSWTETKGTFFYRLRTDRTKVIQCLLMLLEGMSLRATERITKVKVSTLLDWVLRASDHVREINEHLIHDLHFDQVQIDEFWSFIQKKTNVLIQKRMMSNK